MINASHTIFALWMVKIVSYSKECLYQTQICTMFLHVQRNLICGQYLYLTILHTTLKLSLSILTIISSICPIFPRSISWNFFGLAAMEFILNHSSRLMVSRSKILITCKRDLACAEGELSSAKLQTEASCKNRKKSLMKILKSKGPKIDPWGTPVRSQSQELNSFPIFTLWYRLDK